MDSGQELCPVDSAEELLVYPVSECTCDDATGQTRDASDLREVVGVEVFVAGGVELRAFTEALPNAGGLQQRGTEGGVKGRAHGAVF